MLSIEHMLLFVVEILHIQINDVCVYSGHPGRIREGGHLHLPARRPANRVYHRRREPCLEHNIQVLPRSTGRK